jgi:hypothetical protein
MYKKTAILENESITGVRILLDASIDYEHISPFVFRSKPYLLFLKHSGEVQLDRSDFYRPDDEVMAQLSKNKPYNKYEIVGGGHGVIPLFDLSELATHPQVLRTKKIAPGYDPLRSKEYRLERDFGTSNGVEILMAVEFVVKLYEQQSAEGRLDAIIDGLSSRNSATVKFFRELITDVNLLEISLLNTELGETQ